MQSPAVDQFTRFRFLSGLQTQEESLATAFRVTRVEAGEYRHTLWLWNQPDQLRSMADMANSTLFTWENRQSLLFAALRDDKDIARQKKGEDFTVFYRLPIDGGEAARAFELPVEAEAIRPLGEDTFLVLALWKPTQPGQAEENCQVLEEIPFWDNGEGFAGEGRRRLYRYDAGSGKLEPISGEQEQVEDFRVGPKGTVAYSATARSGIRDQRQSLWEYRLGEDKPRLLLEPTLYIHEFDYWNGRLVVAGSDGAYCGLLENPALYLLGEELTLLCRSDLNVGDQINSDCRWGGGNAFQVVEDRLYFLAVQGHTGTLFGMELPGGFPRPLTQPGEHIELFQAVGDTVSLVAFQGQGLQELYRLEPQGLRKVSDFHAKALENVWVGAPKHHVSDRGGCPVDGWVMHPKDFSPERKYPAILNIHGGPKSAYGENYFHEMQYWAGQGYFVLWCNPRGSDGKGDAFADLRGRYGSCDYDDLMGFLDAMLEQYPAIDPHRIGVTGGSYGGFMVNWMIGHTHRFAAAVSQRGISNWTTMALLSDIGTMFVGDQIGSDPWADRDLLWDHSPLKYAKEAKTPTLLLHSDEDYRCPVSECYQMYAALRQNGVECRACVFQGGNHELSRSGKPAHRLRRLIEITHWFDRFCKQ